MCWTATNSYCKCTLTIKWKWVNFTTKYWVSILDLQTLLSHTVFYLSYFELQTGQGQSFDFVCWLLIWRSSRCLLWKAFSQWSHLWFRRSWWAFRTCRLRTWNIIIPIVDAICTTLECKSYDSWFIIFQRTFRNGNEKRKVHLEGLVGFEKKYQWHYFSLLSKNAT